MKTWFPLRKELAMAACLIGSALFALAPLPAEAAPYKAGTQYAQLKQCKQLAVSSPYAWLKSGPGVNFRTYRTADFGEAFALVMTAGVPRHSNGWWLVQNEQGKRYWIHYSVVNCLSGHESERLVKLNKCSQVEVATPTVALRSAPSSRARTYRVAAMGTRLTPVMYGTQPQSTGRGWWLVKTSDGRRYWVHNSFLSCAVMKPQQ